MYRLLLICLLLLLTGIPARPQYILNGAAEQVSCNCYTLTKPQLTQSGSVWNANKINLQQSFDFWFNVYLGCNDSPGADGIVFMLQPLSTSIGTSGAGMGFAGVNPSIGIALDTYLNTDIGDPDYDHISIQANGNILHTGDLAGPVPASSSSNNIEDCQWHRLRISWDANTQWLRAYLDGVLRVEKQVDLVGTIFNNDPLVYWGFSGATGGEVNLQQFCTALDPDFNTQFPGNAACAPASLQFTNSSASFAPITSYTWSFGNGQTSQLESPPNQIFTEPGIYQVSLHVKGLDGCENDTIKTVIIGSVPVADFSISDTCFGFKPALSFTDNHIATTYHWKLDGLTVTPADGFGITNLSQGGHSMEMVAASELGCGNPDTAFQNFEIHAQPQVQVQYSQVCKLLQFTGVQLDNQTNLIEWNWNFGDNQQTGDQNPLHQFSSAGQYNVQLYAKSDRGCISEPASETIIIPQALAFAGNDTAIMLDHPFRLQGEGNGQFLWFPSTGLSDAQAAQPITRLYTDQQYILTVTTPENCIAKDTIRIRVYKGPMAYVPTAFTPNHDGLNEILRPVYSGISSIRYFTVFNRWGQQVFTTRDMKKGWDGLLNQRPQSGSFVWIISATDYLGNEIIYKGTTTIIR